ncbi:MAG: DUF262 domain-containing protein [Candidatus Methylumidiphilus sp.]
MKSYDSRTYSINDFVEWETAKQLELNPRFQRRPVWTQNARSFLMDTVLRGKPIPKVFIRQKINVTTKTSIREVVDGQQRLRTILAFVKDGFVVSKRHNKESGGLNFSQLPEKVQEQVLSYELSVDLLINLPDSEILDIFSRLNSYAVVLNEQERINSDHFGPFKLLCDKLGHKHNQFWIQNRIITEKNIMRMQEVSLVADLIIAMNEGIKDKNQIKKYYGIYEKCFDHDPEEVEAKFDSVISKIYHIFPSGLAETEFKRPFLFYSLFTVVAHCIIGIPGIAQSRNGLDGSALERAKLGLDKVEELFGENEALNQSEREFIRNSTRATTHEKSRIYRTNFILTLIN